MIPSYLPPSPPQSQVFEVVGTCVDSDGHIFGHKVAGIASMITFEKAMMGKNLSKYQAHKISGDQKRIKGVIT